MQITNVNDREYKERSRQASLLRNYFDEKREVLETRQARFLALYPYYGLRRGTDMRRFKATIDAASSTEMSGILKVFENEQMYWSSSYVVDHCNCNIYFHIISTLSEMKKILEGADYSYNPNYNTSNRKQHENISQNSSNSSEGMKRPTTSAKTNGYVNSWGKPGEDAVDYVLKWLPNEYSVIEKDCTGKYGDNIILLENPAFLDETQEYDHIVIGPQGIFNIETKNYSGKLAIDKAGNWLRLKRGETEWISAENPAQQLFRHHVLLQSIVGDQVPIIDMVCMSNPSLLIVGQENSSIPVIKKDLLADYIVGYRSAGLTYGQRKSLEARINSCKKNF
ncbi:hypothetical protein GH808_14975 [Acetobacterium fimetarium]|uniref:NERD domain-containing protein n=1 Tax=Acetobacterium fimetarium TaxID=52691 RepID=A0ABR6WZ00_9FIRM|nr:nuclease-related domain-containing protein [Acetobacterium fimetarium]MBC3805706.1 hypothetical protein [Acetobacterium fimetarium]